MTPISTAHWLQIQQPLPGVTFPVFCCEALVLSFLNRSSSSAVSISLGQPIDDLTKLDCSLPYFRSDLQLQNATPRQDELVANPRQVISVEGAPLLILSFAEMHCMHIMHQPRNDQIGLQYNDRADTLMPLSKMGVSTYLMECSTSQIVHTDFFSTDSPLTMDMRNLFRPHM